MVSAVMALLLAQVLVALARRGKGAVAAAAETAAAAVVVALAVVMDGSGWSMPNCWRAADLLMACCWSAFTLVNMHPRIRPTIPNHTIRHATNIRDRLMHTLASPCHVCVIYVRVH